MLLRPDHVVDAVSDIDPGFLEERGIRGLLIDLDDTLIAAHDTEMHDDCVSWFALLRRSGVPVAILSNGERERVGALCAQLELRGLHLAGKPFGFAFRRGLALLGTPPEATAMVGDQLFTDVLGANLAGMISILVRPLSPGKMPHTRLARKLEHLILRGGDRGRSLHR